MSIKPITEQQKAVLKAAATGGIKSRASIYPEPTVEPVNAFGVLQPDVTGIDNVFIVVSYEKMPNNDTIFCYWDGDTTSIAPVTADTKPKRIPVPDALVIAASGKTINVIYSVIDDANPGGVPSDVHTQVIERYTPPVYPPPVITEAQGGVLDVGALTRNANVTVAAWPGIAVGQRIWLSMTSTPPVTLTKWVGFAITSTGIQTTTISLDKLHTINDGSTIVLLLEVSFDGVTRTPFPTQTYTVKQTPLIAPTITSITDSKGEVPADGTTFDTSVTLTGKAASGQQVEIFDGSISKGTVNVDTSENWTQILTGLTAKAYSIQAKGLYGEKPESAVRGFSVGSQLIIPPSVSLTGTFYWLDNYDVQLVSWPVGTTVNNPARGGQPPYNYTTNNTTVINLNTSSGYITARRNGTATVTVTDSLGQSGSFTVTVTRGRQLSIRSNGIIWRDLLAQAGGWGGSIINPDQARAIYSMYRQNWPGYRAQVYWVTPDYNGPNVFYIDMNNGTLESASGWNSALVAMVVIN
ncbi:MAG: hypothetical protein ACOH2R_07485 [Pseudomonas sp.]